MVNSLPEEPSALIAHVRICGGPGRATALGYPTPPVFPGVWRVADYHGSFGSPRHSRLPEASRTSSSLNRTLP